MLDISRTHYINSEEMPLADGISALERGTALVHTVQNGQGVVTNVGTTANAKFAGFALTERRGGNTKIEVESVVMSEALNNQATATLKYSPKGGKLLVKSGSTVIATSASANTDVDADTEFHINTTTKVLTLNDTYATGTINLTYERDLTATEASQLWGDNVGYQASDITGTIGVIVEGVVYTDQIDVSLDWAAATAIYIDANGLLTTTQGSNTVISSFAVEHVPTADVPFLGLRFRGL